MYISERGKALIRLLYQSAVRAEKLDQLQKSMESLGVSIFDTYGNLKSLDEIFSELNEAMDDTIQKEGGN